MDSKEMNDGIYANIQEFCNAGDKYSSKRVFNKAIEYYNKALLLVPEPKENYEASTWIYTAIGDSNYLSKNYAEALDNFNSAYKSYGGVNNPFVLLRLGQCYHHLDNNKNAREYLLRAYMLEGQEIFENQMEFLNIISDLIETPTKKSVPKVINKEESTIKIPLPKELSEPIWALLEQKPVGETIEEQNANYINGLKKAWDLLPSDKEKYSECFLVLQTIIDASIKRKDYQTLKEYRKFIDEYCPKAENYQSSNEFILGRVAFELGELSEALEFFKSANKKSKGRVFKGKDPKYKAFLDSEK